MTCLTFPCRTVLFVPANRPDRYDKALHSGADLICVDMEDSVLPEQKAGARRQALDYVLEPSEVSTVKSLRINELASTHGLEDLLALSRLERLPAVILMPKVCHSREIGIVREVLGDRCSAVSLFALLETAEGVANAVDIARQPNVDCLMFGSADWAAECGSDMAWDTLLTPRSQIIQAAAQAGIVAMDGAWLNFDDDAGLREESGKIARMGFVGKPVLHPKQIAGVHAAFVPSVEEEERATRIIDAFDSHQSGVLVVDGRMVDKPLITAARRTLMLAKAANSNPMEQSK